MARVTTGLRLSAIQVGVAVTDMSTGLHAHGAIMAALLSRQKTGKGVWVDCDLFESQVCHFDQLSHRTW